MGQRGHLILRRSNRYRGHVPSGRLFSDKRKAARPARRIPRGWWVATRAQLAALRGGDYVSLLLAAILVALAIRVASRNASSAERVVINAGAETYEYPLREDRSIEVTGPLGPTRIEIRDGHVRVVEDPGPRQICVQEGWIGQAGQWLACLPNKVLIRIEGAGEPPVDGYSF